MPAYNAETFIRKSIASVQEQTYTNWELLIVDDGSSDHTAAIIQEMMQHDNRIKYYYQQNAKQAKARNKGLKEASGKIIAFIDADDCWMQHKLETQFAFLQSTNADLVFADTTVFDENGKVYMDSWGVTDAVYSGDAAVLGFMQDNKAPLLTVMVKKESVLKEGGFNEAVEMQYVEDYDLWLRMLQHGANFASSKEKLARYHWNTKKSAERKKTLINVVDALKKIAINDNALNGEKNVAMTLWARKIIKRCTPSINRNDMQKIISLFPSPVVRQFFSILNYTLGAAAVSRLILLYTKELSLKAYKLKGNL